MHDPDWNRMDESEINTFLGQGGTGVISFAADVDTAPVSIPVSYGYNEDNGTIYFQLSVPPGSRKAELVDRRVSFVAYGETDGGWRSVVARGQLEAAEDVPYASTTIQGMWGIEMPRVDIFEHPREELAFRDFYLVPETLTGRKETRSDP